MGKIEFDQTVPPTAKEAWQELAEIVTRLGNKAWAIDYDASVKDRLRAAMLMGRLEMSAELGGFWKGSDGQ